MSIKMKEVTGLVGREFDNGRNVIKIVDENFDFWHVTPYRMNNKKITRLNALLGINKINYFGNKNGVKKK